MGGKEMTLRLKASEVEIYKNYVSERRIGN